ncbi:MAG: ArnT family glycosyltransferase [Candidatus Woesearchaeota archaeon]
MAKRTDAQKKIFFRKEVFFLISILLIGLMIRTVFIFHPSQILFDAKDYDALGKSIGEGKGFNIEGIQNSPYLGIRPPGYPLFLGAIYYLFGYSHFPVYAMQILLDMLVVVMMYLLMGKIFPDKNYKYLAALAWSVNPMSAYYSLSILSENLYIFLFMLSIYIFYVKIYLERKTGFIILLSLIMGYASLVKSFLIHIYILMMIFILYLYFTGYGKNDIFNDKGRYAKNYKKFFMIILSSIFLFAILSSAFMIRNYVIFRQPVNYEVGKSLAYAGGNPNMFTEEDNVYLNNLIKDEYKDLTPMQALENSATVSSFIMDKIKENPALFISNSIIRGSLFWFEPFGIRSLFLLDGGEDSFDKAYTPSLTFILKYGLSGFFKGTSLLVIVLFWTVLLVWLSFLILSAYGLYLLFFRYGKKFLVIVILISCVYFTGIYALTVVVPRYFIQNMLLLSLPFSVAVVDILSPFIKSFTRFKIIKRFRKSSRI